MAWKLEGSYFENCSCEMPCPCTVSFDAGADYDRCVVLLAFHVESGEIEGVDVSGLNVAVVGDAPKVMTEGDWKLGMVVDESASEEQTQKLGAVFGGELGGPMAVLAPLIGEVVGVENAAVRFAEDDGRHSIEVGDSTKVEVEDVVPFGVETGVPAKVTDVFHPANSTLTIGRATASQVSVLGFDFSNQGKSGFSAPFSWSG